MNSTQAKITYLVHSGFSVETPTCFCLFDYCPSLDRRRQITAELLASKHNVYIFASHSHGDHFDPAILEWARQNPAITYILGNDISQSGLTEKCHILSPYDAWEDALIKVHAYGSTDAGVSFLVNVADLAIFHAGDLNWWLWSGETPAEQEYATNYFKAEMAKLQGQQIDIAFFPVDRRLEENFALGAEYFAAAMRPKLLVPMHFGSDVAATKAFLTKVSGKINTVEITQKGQEILFSPADA